MRPTLPLIAAAALVGACSRATAPADAIDPVDIKHWPRK